MCSLSISRSTMLSVHDRLMPFIAAIAPWRSARAAVAVGAICVMAASATAEAQDRPPGVSLGLSVRAGQKTGVLVQPISGAMGDSIATMLSRDLDFSDRFAMIEGSSIAAPAGPANYALYAKLGADGVVQGTVLPSGWLRVALHDVAKKAVVNQKDFALPAPAGSPASAALRRPASRSPAMAACGQLTAMAQM